MHGHKFQIISRSYGFNLDDPVLNPPMELTRANPMRRDTVQVPGEGYTVVRFRSDNPGVSGSLTFPFAVTHVEKKSLGTRIVT
jgi:FtsP/CotA-like multicopper oxidase with cupredoxin domain